MSSLQVLALLFLCSVIDAELSVRASFNDTRCDGGSVCPTDPLLFTCEVNEATSSVIAVTFPSDVLITINLRSTGVVDGDDPPAGVTVFHNVATNVDTVNYILSLAIENASLLNGGMITCDSTVIGYVDTAGCPVAGAPDSPINPRHDVMANTESSAVIRWNTPSNTGGNGISISEYGIMSSDNDLSLTTAVSGDMLNYNITGLEYNTNYSAEVRAINSCGLKSEPANVLVNIEARAPPKPTLLSPELHCDDLLENGRLVVINWMYGAEEKDVVYPGEVVVSVELDPGNIACSDVTTEDTSCIASITRDDVYTVSLTLRNDVGSTQAVVDMFDSLPLQLEQNMDSAGAPGITLTLNPLCRCNAGYTVQVSFGVREEDNNDDCTPEQNKTAGIVPGGSVTLRVNSSTLIPAAGQEYCFIVHELDTLIEGDFSTVAPSDGCSDCESDGLSASAAAGIAVAISITVSLPVGVVIGLCVAWCMMRRGRGATSGGTQQKIEQLQGAIYEEPGPVDTAIPLSDNQAYGHVNMQRRN